MSVTVAGAEQVRGVLFGLAYGDALAARAEFLSVAEIVARWPSDGPRELDEPLAMISDDTQMAVAVGEALTSALSSRQVTSARIEARIMAKFAEWFHSADNTRAPGLTCLSAAARLSQGHPWPAATIVHSKGCGANMRVAPVGLLTFDDGDATHDGRPLSRATLAQIQAAITHGHGTAIAAADLTGEAVALACAGAAPADLVGALRAYAESQRMVYHEAWLGDLWEASPQSHNGVQFIASGWAECLRSLDRVDAALARPSIDVDPCELTGSGWVAEEALATALVCFAIAPDDPAEVLHRAAVTRGDSDSIAAIAGALVGGRHGFAAWPAAWYDRVEWRARIEALATAFVELGARP